MSDSGNQDLPQGWTLTTMGAISDVVGGGTPRTKVAGNFSDTAGHPWLTPADLTNHRAKVIGRGRRFITDQGLATSAAAYMPAGTILFSSRAPIGYVAIANNPVTTNQGFRSFVPSDALDSNYAYHYLKSITALAEQLASGTTFSELSGSKAKALPIPLPPLAEQRRIARRLDQIVEARARIAARLEAARDGIRGFRDAILSAACSGRLTRDWRIDHPDAPSVEAALVAIEHQTKARGAGQAAPELPALPEQYVASTVGQASLKLEYGSSQRASQQGQIPVLRMSNIQDSQLVLDDLKYLADGEVSETLLLEDGDLLFNRTNSPALVGKSAVFHGTERMTFASYLIRVRFAPDVAVPDFVNYWLNSSWGRRWAEDVKTDGVSQSNINGKKLSAMPLPLPPLKEQREIVRRANEMLAMGDQLARAITQTEAMLDKVLEGSLDMAFRGELVPTEARLATKEGREFESAEQLLARINGAASPASS
jgi:type I restriction enzyme, S subunit